MSFDFGASGKAAATCNASSTTSYHNGGVEGGSFNDWYNWMSHKLGGQFGHHGHPGDDGESCDTHGSGGTKGTGKGTKASHKGSHHGSHGNDVDSGSGGTKGSHKGSHEAHGSHGDGDSCDLKGSGGSKGSHKATKASHEGSHKGSGKDDDHHHHGDYSIPPFHGDHGDHVGDNEEGCDIVYDGTGGSGGTKGTGSGGTKATGTSGTHGTGSGGTQGSDGDDDTEAFGTTGFIPNDQCDDDPVTVDLSDLGPCTFDIQDNGSDGFSGQIQFIDDSGQCFDSYEFEGADNLILPPGAVMANNSDHESNSWHFTNDLPPGMEQHENGHGHDDDLFLPAVEFCDVPDDEDTDGEDGQGFFELCL